MLTRKKISFEVTIVVEPDDNGFHAYCPALRGLHVGGETKEEAVKTAQEAVILYLKSLLKHNEPIPLCVVSQEQQPSFNFVPDSFREKTTVLIRI